MADEGVKATIDKVIEKLCRVTVADGRVYLGILMAVDQTKTVYMQDALELFDREDESFVEHELLTSHMLSKIQTD